MSDLLADARETLEDISSRRPGQTHYEGCRTGHTGCLLAELVAEVGRLRLTNAEREAIRVAADAYASDVDDAEFVRIAVILRGLLKRTGGEQ